MQPGRCCSTSSALRDSICFSTKDRSFQAVVAMQTGMEIAGHGVIFITRFHNTCLVSLLLLLHSLCLSVLSEPTVDWKHLHSGETRHVLDLLNDHLGTGPLRLHPLLQCALAATGPTPDSLFLDRPF